MTHKSHLSHCTEAFAIVLEYISTAASGAIIALGIKTETISVMKMQNHTNTDWHYEPGGDNVLALTLILVQRIVKQFSVYWQMRVFFFFSMWWKY